VSTGVPRDISQVKKGNSGNPPVYSGEIFVGKGVLGPVFASIYDPGGFYLLIFDKATAPANNDVCDLSLGQIIGPGSREFPRIDWPMTDGCWWALSTTSPVLTIASGGVGAFLSWLRWGTYGR